MATLKGLAFLWGVDGTTYTGVPISSSTGKIQSTDFSRESDVEEISDKDGDVVGRAYFNLRKALRVSVVPSNSGTLATAITNADNMLPAPGSTVTLTGADGSIVDGDHSGVYLVDRANVSRTNRSAAVIDLELTQFDANDVSSAVS